MIKFHYTNEKYGIILFLAVFHNLDHPIHVDIEDEQMPHKNHTRHKTNLLIFISNFQFAKHSWQKNIQKRKP